MSYPVANSQIDSTGDTTTTLSFTPTLGNYLVVLMTNNASIAAPTDSKSNTWHIAGSLQHDTTDGDYAVLYYAKVTSTGSGIVITQTGGGSIIIAELAGLDGTTPFNAAAGGTAQNTTVTNTISATGGGNVVAIGGGWSNGTAANTPGGAYTKVQEQIDDVSHERIFMQIGSSVTAGSITFNWTANALGWVQTCAAFNIAGGGGVNKGAGFLLMIGT